MKVTFSSKIVYIRHEILNVSVPNKSPCVQNLEKRIAVSVENRSLGGQNVKKLISVPGLLFDTLEYLTMCMILKDAKICTHLNTISGYLQKLH